MTSSATLAQLRSYRTSVTTALLDQHRRKGLNVPMFRQAAEPVATITQMSYLADLMDRLATHNPAVHTDARTWITGLDQLTRVDASRAIDAVKRHLAAPAAAPARPTSQASASADLRPLLARLDVDTRYAVEAGGEGSNDWRFYRLAENGFGFRYLQVGHADGHGMRWERLSVPAQLITARAIARNPREAMLNFGRKIGRCGHCGRVLTNQASREAGIGPICASK